MIAGDRIRLAVADSVATITLARPEKLNAVDPAMLKALDAALATVEEADDVRAVILTGDGDRAFCSGADIEAWAALPPLDMWRRWVPAGHRTANRLASMRQPVIAALNGSAFGGGLELALAADLRLVADHALLGMPEAKVAAVPGWGGSRRLPRLVGAARAKELIFTGEAIDAPTAERWGLVNRVVPADALIERAVELATQISARAPLSVQLTKQLIDAEQADAVSLEGMAGSLTAGSDDGREGVASFRERRQPTYGGR